MSTTRLTFAWFVTAALLLATFFCTPTAADTITITGTVLTPDGQPAAEARVFVLYRAPDVSPFAVAEALSDAQGRFSFTVDSRQPQRRVQVGALKEGFALDWDLVEPGGEVTLQLGADPVTCRGTVTNSRGGEIEGAEVVIRTIQRRDKFGDWRHLVFGEAKILREVTDEAGRFAFANLPADAGISPYASAEGFATLVVGNVTPPNTFARQQDIELVLQPEAVISGRVARLGEPISDVRVWSQAAREGNWAEDVTDDQGRYTLQAVQQGIYNVCLNPPEGWTAVAHEGVKCVPGQKIENMDFELIEGGLVTGTVTDAATGRPAAGVGIGAYGPARPFSGAGVQAMKTDEKGQYIFRLPPGKNRLYLQGGAGYSYDDTEPDHHMIDVVAGQTVAGIDFRAWASRKVTGTVLYPDLQPAPDAYVRGSAHFVSPSHTDRDGHFELNIPPSQFPVEFMAKVVDRKLIGRAVVSDPDEDVRLVLQPQAVVTGAIASADGEGITNVQIKCRYVPPHPEGRPFSLLELSAATTDDNGRFELALLPAGVELKLQILGDAGPYVSQTQWPDELVLQAGETRDIGTAVVDMKGRTIRGLVMDAERVLQPDCFVLDVSSSAQTRTDELGRFELTGIPYKERGTLARRPYEADLLAMHPELLLFAGDFGIDPDWGFEPNMVLEALGKVQGRLLDADGKPVGKQEIGLQALGIGRPKPKSYSGPYQRGVRLWDTTETDAQGRWSFDGMISGLKYVVNAYRSGGGSPIFWREITPEPGRTIDLGDIDKTEPQ